MKKSHLVLFPKLFLLIASILATSCTTRSVGGLGTTHLNYDASERKMINQATGIGAVLGAAAGYYIAKNNGGWRLPSSYNGAVIGALVGNSVGTSQAKQARERRMGNAYSRDILSRANKNNGTLKVYNQGVKDRVELVKTIDPSKQRKLALAEIRSVNKAISSTDKLIQLRRKGLLGIKSKQLKKDYAAEIKAAERHRAELVQSRNKLIKFVQELDRKKQATDSV